VSAGRWWLRLIILATQEAEIRRIVVQSQPGQTVPQNSISKNPSKKKNRASGVAQGDGPVNCILMFHFMQMILQTLLLDILLSHLPRFSSEIFVFKKKDFVSLGKESIVEIAVLCLWCWGLNSEPTP
jgi:hypothetical protein